MISILTNKHFLIAMLVAPILAVITWFAVGKVAGPTPIVAEDGQSYPLIAKPNCRYESGQCTLINNEFRIDIRPFTGSTANADNTESIETAIWLGIESKFPIDGATFSLLDEKGETFMTAEASEFDEGGTRGILLPPTSQNIETMRVALSSDNVIYYAETQTKFLSYIGVP